MVCTNGRIALTLIVLLVFSSCSISGQSRFLFLQKELTDVSKKSDGITSINFDHQSKIIIWMHGTTRPAVSGNLNCTKDMPPESLFLAAEKLNFSIYYLCSNATDGREQGSFIYKRVNELEEVISHLNQAGIPSKNIFLSGFSAGGWTALMAASVLPNHFNRGVLFAPAFSGPRYEASIFPVWRKIIRPKQISQILKAKSLDFLIFAYEDDPFNRPKDLDFFLRTTNSNPVIIGYNCNKGHFTYTKDCKGEETSKKIYNFFQDSKS